MFEEHKDPKFFDYSKKNFLNYKEYQLFCVKNKRIPLKKSEIGENIQFNQIKFQTYEPNKELFDLLSDNSNKINWDTL